MADHIGEPVAGGSPAAGATPVEDHRQHHPRCVAAPDVRTHRSWAPRRHPPRKIHAMHNLRNHMDLLLAAAAGFIVLADLGVPVLTHLPVLAVCPLRWSS